jgi:hypothetical protein
MASKAVMELKTKTDSAWANLTRQLDGMEPYMERSDAPGEWTTREVLSHLMFPPGFDPVPGLRSFSAQAMPTIDIDPGQTYLDDDRRRMTLKQFLEALDAQRRGVYGYLEGLPEADLTARKARIPLFKQFMGTDEIPLGNYVGALWDYHWNDHAGQLAKIRKAVGLPA